MGRTGKHRRQERKLPAGSSAPSVGSRERIAARRHRALRGGGGSWLMYKRAVLRFVVLLALCMVGFNILFILWLTPSEFFHTYLRLNAGASATVLQVLGDDASVTGTSITSPRFSVNIQRGCEAIQVSAFYIFAVLLWPLPASWRQRAMGMAVGTLLLLTLNLVRIVSLYYIGIYFPSAFEPVHIDVWQPAFIVLALFFWVIWVRWVTRAEAVKADVAV